MNPNGLANRPLQPLEYFSIRDIHMTLYIEHVNILNGGEGGIRTHGPLRTSVFKTDTLNHSDTSPRGNYLPY
jgi:hypothetical protein